MCSLANKKFQKSLWSSSEAGSAKENSKIHQKMARISLVDQKASTVDQKALKSFPSRLKLSKYPQQVESIKHPSVDQKSSWILLYESRSSTKSQVNPVPQTDSPVSPWHRISSLKSCKTKFTQQSLVKPLQRWSQHQSIVIYEKKEDNHCLSHIFSTLGLRVGTRKIQKYYFLSMGLREHLE